MQETLKQLETEAIAKVEAASSLKEVNDIRVQYLGKKGPITEVLRGMGKLSAEERPKMGALANEVREQIASAIAEKNEQLEKEEVKKKLASQTIDVTLPASPIKMGARHPLTIVVEDIEDLFIGMGYTVEEGPEVETDYYNFEALNLPKEHPARDMQDSFYITEDTLMRTQTSPVQARTLEKYKGQGPVKIICPGKVYRRDSDDATHSHQFMQIEGLVVDHNISMSDLKGTLETVARKMFGEDREIRLRPSFFPFTEPSVEVDVSCFKCGGKGCSVCKGTGWIEILGAGMVHPNVLKMSGFDPETYQGFAFGMGVERIAMLKYGIDDIRHFYTNDIRFIKQFKQD
ncbi:phenylalanine--tRNA ligase subunit alpha [Bacillus safensis]|uniref:phenylalanine--tRNA ligase subunit alpha n=1 Tax=Bacillus safensis TaxID=561879 RepID=UPI0021C5E71B|nr:phenylalanine--tRNA ligase subunit alpha [Bacillus safensis]MCU0156795.1 phenylalanine--tRNA ligase subunit alpha [Bacillus safensis]